MKKRKKKEKVILKGLDREDFYEVFLIKDSLPLVRGSNPQKHIALIEMKKFAKDNNYNIIEEILQ